MSRISLKKVHLCSSSNLQASFLRQSCLFFLFFHRTYKTLCPFVIPGVSFYQSMLSGFWKSLKQSVNIAAWTTMLHSAASRFQKPTKIWKAFKHLSLSVLWTATFPRKEYSLYRIGDRASHDVHCGWHLRRKHLPLLKLFVSSLCFDHLRVDVCNYDCEMRTSL